MGRPTKVLLNVVAAHCLVFVAVLSLPIVAFASTYAIPYKIGDNQTLLPGMLVVVDSNNKVRASHYDEGYVTLGSVASLPDSALPIGSVGVTSSGLASVLVSDISGKISKGDRIALSSIDGIGMRAVTAGWVVGVAQGEFNGDEEGVTRQLVETGIDGGTWVAIKSVPVLLSVTYYNPEGGIIIGTAQGIVDLVAGHSVSIGKTVTAMIIFGIAVLVMVVMMYSSVKSSLISIGRNPMASKQIVRALTKVMLYMLLVVLVAMLTIYFVIVT